LTVKSIQLSDELRLWKLEAGEAVRFRDGESVPPLRAQPHLTSIQVVNEFTVATFLLTIGPEHAWVSHVRFDRAVNAEAVVTVSWETYASALRRGYAKTAVAVAVGWTCREHALRYVTAWIREGHVESEATARSAGFQAQSTVGQGRTWIRDCARP
jgi:RimJ/RimL family protein N-acetyltransferase